MELQLRDNDEKDPICKINITPLPHDESFAFRFEMLDIRCDKCPMKKDWCIWALLENFRYVASENEQLRKKIDAIESKKEFERNIKEIFDSETCKQ